jgi:hypothetical protein
LFHADLRTNMTKLIATFSNLAEAPKKIRERASYIELQTVR